MAQKCYNLDFKFNNTYGCYKTILEKYKMVGEDIERGCYDNFSSQFNFEIKELIENFRYYISEGAYNLGDSIWKSKYFETKNEIINEVKSHLFSHEKCQINFWYLLDKNQKDGKVTWEHIVPSSVKTNEIIKLIQNNEFTYDKYLEIRNKFGGICIVTKEEDDLLNKSHLRQRMPDNNLNNPFARYEMVGIKIKEL